MHANFTFGDHRARVIQICKGILSGKKQERSNIYLQLFIIVVLPCINKVTCDKFISLMVLGSEFPIL